MNPALVNKHQNVDCPRCQRPFTCRAGTISVCQCSTLVLTDAQHRYINFLYQGCLCANCLFDLQSEYTQKTGS
ncbi:cysteine-rich CWC family protein [Spirosoma pollinicola]|uniref:Cysteine-rich CWC family protein n=1 Tax=Spirosoma pollinicola TaxID=2057025 RepID=A0A2K8YU52_9BACT|nr:hypothetical protein CWM47_04600 [Spirosoma pollinicola]